MTNEEFWKIINRFESLNQENKLLRLTADLQEKEPEEIASFDSIYRDMLQRAYTWDLWGAAYVINDGCSSDSFDYFCDWLISQGQYVFEAAVENPESLADSHLPDFPFFEEYRYVAGEVYKEKTGIEMPIMDDGNRSGGPAGD